MERSKSQVPVNQSPEVPEDELAAKAYRQVDEPFSSRVLEVDSPSINESNSESNTLFMLLDLLGHQKDEGSRLRRDEAMRWLLKRYAVSRLERQDRQLALARVGAAALFFCGGIVLALQGYQDIGFFILGCSTGLLGEAKGGSK